MFSSLPLLPNSKSLFLFSLEHDCLRLRYLNSEGGEKGGRGWERPHGVSDGGQETDEETTDGRAAAVRRQAKMRVDGDL